MGEQDFRAGNLERVVDLRRHVAVVQRHRHLPALHAGEIVDDQRGTVRHQRSDAIAGDEAEVVAGKGG